MFKFKAGDRIVANERAPLGNGGRRGEVLWIEADEELRDPFYTVRFDGDKKTSFLAEDDLIPEPKA